MQLESRWWKVHRFWRTRKEQKKV